MVDDIIASFGYVICAVWHFLCCFCLFCLSFKFTHEYRPSHKKYVYKYCNCNLYNELANIQDSTFTFYWFL